MPLSALPRIDTRGFFRPVSVDLVALLRGLPPADWHRPTVAGAWRVREVVAHLVDVTLRRLSFHRDRMTPPAPSLPISSERDFVNVINGLNAEWIAATRRCSPRVLTDLFERASIELADWVEPLPLDAPALFGVSWAGEETSEGWFDIGREFTELWHHQQQIRIAVEAPSLSDARYLRAVIEIAVRGLPYAFRDIEAPAGQTLVFDVDGKSGGRWTLASESAGWKILEGDTPNPTTRLRLSDDAAWRLLFNALPEHDAVRVVHVEGEPALAAPLLKARSVIV